MDVKKTGVILFSKSFVVFKHRVTGVNGLYIDRQQQMQALGC